MRISRCLIFAVGFAFAITASIAARAQTTTNFMYEQQQQLLQQQLVQQSLLSQPLLSQPLLGIQQPGQQNGFQPPFVMPPDSYWRTPQMTQIPNFLSNPLYGGQATYAPFMQSNQLNAQPNMQDPWTMVGTNIPPKTRVHEIKHYSDDDDTEVQADSNDDEKNNSDFKSIKGDQFYVSKKNLAQQQNLGNGKYLTTSTLRGVQRFPRQNDLNSKTEAGPPCRLCQQLQQDENMRNLFLAKLDAAAAGVPKNAYIDAKECFVRMLMAKRIHNPNCMVVVDFNQPTTAKRLYMIDMRDQSKPKLIRSIVSQGMFSSGGPSCQFATQYSNKDGSNESSPGCYLAGELYPGQYYAGPSKIDKLPQSLKLDGQDPGVNNLAEPRTIVAHGYQLRNGGNPSVAADTEGCFGLGTNQATVDLITHCVANGGIWYAEKLAPGGVSHAYDQRCRRSAIEAQKLLHSQ